jgi:hypothetical protein
VLARWLYCRSIADLVAEARAAAGGKDLYLNGGDLVFLRERKASEAVSDRRRRPAAQDTICSLMRCAQNL